ncbi:bifunctional metallophosphatase/5'-nucleotidase [Actinopolymorpha alba]|uniref:bifunctional metallophosphatase/5'-nucleotidase n=1 Tax=Actinopolymorpha alba TaxID=533267 RepID=UPI00035FF719|nr:bifunctional metallophosphatase/5'-nucleotidase [Actinopolymorpha alba]
MVGALFPVLVLGAGAGAEVGGSVTKSAVTADATSGSGPRIDATTRGDRRGVYGADGHVVVGDQTTHLPPGVEVQIGGSPFVWDADATDFRALQRPDGEGRVAAARYGGQFDTTISVPAGQAYRLAVYLLDYDTNNTRAQTLTLTDSSGAVLSTYTATRFASGRYLLWDIDQDVTLRIVRTGGANAVLSGLFLDPIGTPDPDPDATPPTVRPEVVGSRTPGGAYTGWARVTAAADDGSGAGVDMVEYARDGGAWQAYEGPLWVRNPDSHAFAFRASDLAGNVSAVQSVQVDVVSGESDVVPLRLLGLNDYHGADVNGPRLATMVGQLRAEQPNTALLGVGDLIGWTSFVNDATRDEFVVDYLEYLRMDAYAAGNHEFDEGIDELLRIKNGGCHQVDGCFDHDGDGTIGTREYDGAAMPILVANLVDKHNRKQVFPGSVIVDVDGVKVGIIGTTTDQTAPGIGVELFPHHEFIDPAVATNREAAKLAARGVKVMVALVHEGGNGSTGSCTGRSGPIFDIADRIDARVDVVMSGHYHTSYSCVIPDPSGAPRPVLAGTAGATQLQVADLIVSRDTGEVDRSLTAVGVRDVSPALPGDSGARDIINRATAIANAKGGQIVGRISGDILRGRNPAGGLDPTQESPLLNLHADAELAWVRANVPNGADFGLADHLLVNGDLTYRRAAGEPEDGIVTWRETWLSQIYDARMLVLKMTGAEVERVLREQWDEHLLMGVSHNVRYLRDPTGHDIPGHVRADLVFVDGEPLDRERTYRVAVNSIIARGFDRMPAFRDITRRYDTGVPVRTAHNAYLAEHSPVGPEGLSGRMPTAEDVADNLVGAELRVDGHDPASPVVSLDLSAPDPYPGPITVTATVEDPLQVSPVSSARGCTVRPHRLVCVYDSIEHAAEFAVRVLTERAEPGRYSVDVDVAGPFIVSTSATATVEAR